MTNTDSPGGGMQGIGVHGIGPVCALGSGIEAFRGGLEGAISPRIDTEPAPPEWGVRAADSSADGEQTPPAIYYSPVVAGLEKYVSPRTTRRLDSFSKQAVLAAFLAVEDAGIEFTDLSRVGVVIGTGNGPLVTTFSFLDGIIAEGDAAASPTLFANSVHNAPASQISIRLKTIGPCSTVTAFRDTVREVLDLAASWIEGGLVDYCVAGFGDEYCPVSGYALRKMRERRDGGDDESPLAIRPFDFTRDTYIPGGGFTAFLLGGERGRYGTLSVRSGEVSQAGRSHGILTELHGLVPDAGLMVVSADGGRRATDAFGTWLPAGDDGRLTRFENGLPCISCVPLYGGMMIGAAFDLAAGAVCLHDRRLYRPRSTSPGGSEPLGGSSVVCIEHREDGKYGVYVLH